MNSTKDRPVERMSFNASILKENPQDPRVIKVTNEPGWECKGLGVPIMKDGEIIKDRSHIITFERVISDENPTTDVVIEPDDVYRSLKITM